MEALLLFLKYFTVIFLILFSCDYFIPAALWYYLFYIKKKEQWKHMRIQQKYPSSKQIRREIKYSALSVLIFSFISVFLYYCVLQGYTKLYFNINEYGIFYFIISFVIIVLIHDTLFYWSHRFMHIKKVFKYFHKVHHQSINPSPFSIYAFQPGEAIIEYLIYPVVFFLIPVHPFMLGFFMLYNIVLNLAGHSGYELVSENFRRHHIFRWQNSVTNHDKHHTNSKYNFGFYFTFWDKWMNTLAEEKKP